MNQTLKDRYHANYAPLVKAFAAEVGTDLNAADIPEPHLPCFGTGYAEASPKLVVIGRDTKYWHDMTCFLRAATADPLSALDRHEQDFHEFTFTTADYNYNFGRTFWATLLKLLAGFHGVNDWQALRRREHPEILRSFAWAQTNSVEHFEATAAENNADHGAWQKLKAASERHLDSFGLLMDTFQPDIAVIMSRRAPAGYWNRNLRWEPVCDRLECARDEAGVGTLVFRTDHPGFLSRSGHYDEVLAAILDRGSQR